MSRIKLAFKFLLAALFALSACNLPERQGDQATPAAVPMLSVSAASEYRSGPGPAYELVGVLQPGEMVMALGMSPDASYLLIRDPADPESLVWLKSDFATLAGDSSGLPVSTPPPLPTALASPEPMSGCPTPVGGGPTPVSCPTPIDGPTPVAGCPTPIGGGPTPVSCSAPVDGPTPVSGCPTLVGGGPTPVSCVGSAAPAPGSGCPPRSAAARPRSAALGLRHQLRAAAVPPRSEAARLPSAAPRRLAR